MNLQFRNFSTLPHRMLPLAVALVLALGLPGCDRLSAQAQNAEQAQQDAPPPQVGVITVKPTTVALTTDLPGRLEPIRTAQVRARVNGILMERVFTEGSDVKAGQLLYRIDAAPYQAVLQSAKAQLAQAQAQLSSASALAKRYKPLVSAKAVSQQEYDAAVASANAANAQVAAAKAAVRSADINLGYTAITAPISGHIGRSQVTEGALVSQTEGTQLATIQQIDKLYLNITQPAAAVLQMREALRAGEVEQARGEEAAKVEVILENGQIYSEAARLLFTDLTVDPSTGQVQLRAEVPNPQGLLLPGMYVRARLQQGQLDNAILLPQQTVTRNEQGDTVMVVGEDGSVQPRPVTVAGSHGTDWIVTDGLEPGEMVMADGVMKVSMGAQKVQPVPWKPGEPTGAAVAPDSSKAAQSGSEATETAPPDAADDN